ncbi:hypothetical protein ACFQJ8_23255 [Halocatena marina]
MHVVPGTLPLPDNCRAGIDVHRDRAEAKAVFTPNGDAYLGITAPVDG